jgi:hypothetical protein
MDSDDSSFSLCVQSFKQRWQSVIKLINAELMLNMDYICVLRIADDWIYIILIPIPTGNHIKLVLLDWRRTLLGNHPDVH